VSLHFNNTKILQATFSAACIVDFKKNEHASEIAYNGKTVDIVHISTLSYGITLLAEGTLISIDIEKLQSFLDNDEAYFIWRMPHKSLDEIFKTRVNVGNMIDRLRDLITTPVVSEKYGYSVRVNESRLLPEEITRIGAFHRQKLKKAVVTLSVDESYEINDISCYRIRRLEENLYEGYLPDGYKCEDSSNCTSGFATLDAQDNESRLEYNFDIYYKDSDEVISENVYANGATKVLMVNSINNNNIKYNFSYH
jgi:hypothetical protein